MRRRHRPGRIQQRLSRRHERYLYLSGSALLLSGIGWLIGHYFLRDPAAFGGAAHPSEAWWMRLHAAARDALTLARLRLVVTVQAMTGYGLYYLVDERQRALTSALHWVIGLAASAALVVHIVLGKRLAASARERRLEGHRHRLAAGTSHASPTASPQGGAPLRPR